jgi:hypothetical protein
MRGWRALAAAGIVAVALLVPGASAARLGEPITLTGSGDRVETVFLAASPAVVSFSHHGESDLLIRLQGPGVDELIAYEVGPYAGQAAVAGVVGGSYQLVVETDGSWMATITQPRSKGGRKLPGSFSGSGSAVLKVRVLSPVQPVLTASNTGDSNFIVYLIRLARSQHDTLLVNDLGPWSGKMLVSERLAKGIYLLEVYAAGGWSLAFSG